MIGRLQGVVVEQSADSSCVVDVGGVGYEVFVPVRTLRDLDAPPEIVTLHVHTYVREDSLSLYGFSTREDRAAFRALLGVSGVGPKLALVILNDLGASELAITVAREDKNRLKGINGVGKKMAERLVIDLRDRIPATTAASQVVESGGTSPSAGRSDTASLVTNALIQMGFGRLEAEKAVKGVVDRRGDMSVEDMLRETLSTLA